jgi:hypothetical protein
MKANRAALSQPMLVAELFKVAKEVQAWAEITAARLGRDQANLRGMCVIAAYELFDRLSKNARLKPHKVRFAKSEYHAFVMVDGLTVDVTATQFVNTDPVEGVWIVDLTDEPDPGVWLATEFADSTHAVLQLPCWSRWPRTELPLPMQMTSGSESDLQKRFGVRDAPANISPNFRIG